MLVCGRRPKSALASHAAFATNPQATLQDGLQGGLVYVEVPYLNLRSPRLRARMISGGRFTPLGGASFLEFH